LLESIIKELMSSMKCSVCGQRYELGNIKILGHEEHLWLLRIACSSCHTQYLVAAGIRKDRMNEAITDLTDVELEKFKNSGIPSSDEVLDMHNFLKNFNGDFSQLFQKGT